MPHPLAEHCNCEDQHRDVLICCGECYPNVYTANLVDMIAHILTKHPNYKRLEAEIYAQIWLEDACAKWEEEQESYLGWRKDHKESGDY